MSYILLYIIILIGMLLNNKFKKKEKNLILLFYIIFLVIFFGLRGFVWTDWNHYYPNFLSIEPIYKIFDLNSNYRNIDYEIGYKIYMSIIKVITSDYHIFTLISTLFDLFLIKKIFDYYNIDFLFGILLFIGFEGLALEFDLMRNSKAILLYVYSIKYFDEKKYLKYLVLNLLAISFHKSIIINTLITPLLIYYYNFYIRISLFFTFILYKILQVNFIKKFLFCIKDLLPLKYLNKIESYLVDPYYNVQSGIGIVFLEKTALFILVLFLYNKIYKKELKNKIILNSSFVYFFTYYILGEMLVLQERVGTNYIYIYWLLIPLILKELTIYKRLITKTLVLLYIFLKFIKNFIFIDAEEIKKSLNYENIIFYHKNYSERYQEFIEYHKYRIESREKK